MTAQLDANSRGGPRRLSLQTRLVLLVLAAMLPLIGFTLALQYLEYQADRRSAGQQALALARSMMLVVERDLQSRITALEVLASSTALQAGDLVAFRRRAEAVATTQFPGANIILLDGNGQQLLNTAAAPGAALPMRRHLEPTRQVFATGQPVVSDLFMGALQNRLLISVEVPVRGPDGQVKWSLAMNPAADAFAAIIRAQQPPFGWVVTLFDRQGVIVARTPNGEQALGRKASADFLPYVLAGKEIAQESHSLEGVALLSALSPGRSFGWSVGVGVPQAQLTGPALATLTRSMAVALAVLLAGLLLAFVMARRISRPIAALRRLAETTGGDAPGLAAASALEETATVAAALQAAENRRRQSEAEEHRAADSLRRTETQLRLFIEWAPAAMAVFDRDMRYLAVSRRYREDFRLGDQELLGRSHYEVFPTLPADRRLLHQRCLAGAVEHGESRTDIRGDGKRDWLRWEMRPWYDGTAVGGIVMMLEFVTERRAAEAARDELLARQRTILDRMPIGCMVIDEQRRFTYFNPAAERIFGRSFAEVEGKDPFETITPPDAQASAAAARRRLQEGEAVVDVVGENLTKDGRRIVCEWRMCELREPGGRFLGVLSMCVDVTERRQVEEQLRQSQKMEAVGQLTGGVAHDFNNLLLIIMGGVDAVEEQLKDRPGLREQLERVMRAVERGATLTRSLLAFARKQPLAPVRVDLNRLVQDMEPLLVRTLGEAIDIEVVKGGGLWRCEVDVAQLQNALLNLAVNARDAMAGGGKLTIETANSRLDSEYAARHAEVTPGQYVGLTVSDTGSGMTAEVAARAFDPFFSTKAGGGSGLGLSMVYGFVKQSGGHVKIYSEPGHGTSVKLYLPRSYDGPVEHAVESGPAELPGGGETVLVVEDDADVRELAVGQLRSLGYAVLGAASAAEAMRLIEQQPITLLLTDVVLTGGVNGRQLADQAVERLPGLKVLYMSGYTENAILHHGRLDPDVELLQKPFRKKDLALKVRAVLDARG